MINAKLYQDDLERAQELIPELDKMQNARILITGANGLICSAIADFLLCLNDKKDYKIKVFLAARSEKKINGIFGELLKSRNDLTYIKYDANEPITGNETFDYIIHGASNATPATYIQQPVETMVTNFAGIKNVLDYAMNNQTKRVLYISSSEVYGKKLGSSAYKEDEYGFLDILNPRACYPSSKRAAETLCMAYMEEYGVASVIVRPGHIYGPTANDSDNRIASQIPRNILVGQDIVLKSAGTQLRSYCYVIDCLTAILTVLLRGVDGEAYNISNKNSIVTIREMAKAFAKAGDKKVVFEKASDAEEKGFNPMDNSSLNSEKLEALGWKGVFDLNKGTEHTLQCLEAIVHKGQ